MAFDSMRLQPVLNLIRDEFRPVVAADETWRSVLVNELFEHLNDVLRSITLACGVFES